MGQIGQTYKYDSPPSSIGVLQTDALMYVAYDMYIQKEEGKESMRARNSIRGPQKGPKSI